MNPANPDQKLIGFLKKFDQSVESCATKPDGSVIVTYVDGAFRISSPEGIMRARRHYERFADIY